MDLFPEHRTKPVAIAAGACWLPGFALSVMPTLWQSLQQHLAAHPAQQMMTPMGLMSVATSSMGHWGWVGSSQGYG